MKTRAILAWVVVLAITTKSQAAKLVVMAVNSGTDTTNNAHPPVDPPGAKGFLIGIDKTMDPLEPLGFQDLTFHGPNVVQRLAPNSASPENGLLDSPNVQTRSSAVVANIFDPVPGSTFGSNDSWWWNRPHTVGSTTLTLTPIVTGIEGGLPGGPMTMTGSYNPFGVVPPGVWPVAYIVATGDVFVTGILAGGQTGFDFATGLPMPDKNVPSAATLYFEASSFILPEPSTLALAGAGLLSLAIMGWKRRKKVVRNC